MRAAGPFVLIVALLAVMQFFLPALSTTGGEARYVAAGLGMFAHPSLEAVRAAPSLGPGAVFGLPLRLFGTSAARWLNFVIGAVGLFALYALLRTRFSSGNGAPLAVAAGVLAISAFAIPYVEYARLLYPEILLFTTVAIASYALVTQRRATLFVAAGLLPFEHARGLPLSLAFAALALGDAMRGRGANRSVAREGLAYVAMLGAWALLDIRVYGSVTGAASLTHAPSVAMFLPRLGAQLFNVRHGLIVYAPIYLLAFAGLISGTIGRDAACARAAALLFVYVATFVWSTAGDSWSARFWVPAVPMLAAGLAYWLTFARSLAARVVFVFLAALTLYNTISFFLHPTWFLDNRTSSPSYDALSTFAHLPLSSLLRALDVDNGDAVRAMAWLAATAIAILGLIALEAATSRAPAAARARARAPRSARGAARRRR